MKIKTEHILMTVGVAVIIIGASEFLKGGLTQTEGFVDIDSLNEARKKVGLGKSQGIVDITDFNSSRKTNGIILAVTGAVALFAVSKMLHE